MLYSVYSYMINIIFFFRTFFNQRLYVIHYYLSSNNTFHALVVAIFLIMEFLVKRNWFLYYLFELTFSVGLPYIVKTDVLCSLQKRVSLFLQTRHQIKKIPKKPKDVSWLPFLMIIYANLRLLVLSHS